MRIGTQTGSVTNYVYGNMTGAPTPEVGMGATVLAWTDRHACTIIEVRPDGGLVMQEDDAKRTDSNGMSEDQRYEYTRNPNGRIWTFRQVKRGKDAGRYVEAGAPRGNGRGLLIGDRRKYHDFSF